MADYTNTFFFPEKALGTGDNLQTQITFITTDQARTFVAVDEGVRILKYGKLSWRYRIDEPLMVPGRVKMDLVDQNGVFAGFLFPAVGTEVINPLAEVQISINGTVEFKGKIAEDSARYDLGTKVISFEVEASLQAINDQMIYDLDDATVNPFGYTNSTYVPVTTMLEDIFSLANSGITYPDDIEIIHGWAYVGDTFPLTGPTNFGFADLHFLIGQFYFNASSGMRTVGDVLRRLALDHGAFAGLISNDRAFFKQLFTYDSSNTQEIGTVLKHVRRYEYGLIDWVRIEPLSDPNGQVYEAGNETQLEDRYILQDSLAYYYDTGSIAASSVKAYTAGPTEYTIWWSHYFHADGTWDSNEAHGQTLADFLYEMRGRISSCILDEFTLYGLTYDYLKDFEYDGKQYQPVEMEKDLETGITTIAALYVGDA